MYYLTHSLPMYFRVMKHIQVKEEKSITRAGKYELEVIRGVTLPHVKLRDDKLCVL